MMKGNSVNSDKKGALITTCRKDYFSVFMLPVNIFLLVLIAYQIIVSILKRFPSPRGMYLLILILLVAESGVYLSLRLFIFPMAIATSFKIYKNGFIPAERTLGERIKRKDIYIPFDEIEIVDVIYHERYLDRDTEELPLDPEYIRKMIIHLKDGNTRTVELFWDDNKCGKKLLEILEKKGVIRKKRYTED
ncbi:MAG: hypothetical protein DRN40_07650 [Thermoplasmata archaeon]|nr:MAG: hypothetical protein DRN40_07650 [Thermoplasmata archaeon]